MKQVAVVMAGLALLLVVVVWHENAAGPKWEAEKKLMISKDWDDRFKAYAKDEKQKVMYAVISDPRNGYSTSLSISAELKAKFEREHSDFKRDLQLMDNPYAWFR